MTGLVEEERKEHYGGARPSVAARDWPEVLEKLLNLREPFLLIHEGDDSSVLGL